MTGVYVPLGDALYLRDKFKGHAENPVWAILGDDVVIRVSPCFPPSLLVGGEEGRWYKVHTLTCSSVKSSKPLPEVCTRTLLA